MYGGVIFIYNGSIMKIAVCEDTRVDRDCLCAYIQDYCAEHCYTCTVSAFDTGEALLGAFSPGAYSLIFLDIFMLGISDVDAARKIRESDRDCMLVFITDSPDFTMDGFLVQAVLLRQRHKRDGCKY
jgi:DNA-binding LytR/AlgR family response regulator